MQQLASLILVGLVVLQVANTNAFITHIDFRFGSSSEAVDSNQVHGPSPEVLKKAARDARAVVHKAGKYMNIPRGYKIYNYSKKIVFRLDRIRNDIIRAQYVRLSNGQCHFSG